jgi:hypothetical protein
MMMSSTKKKIKSRRNKMGVDYEKCDECGQVFADCGDNYPRTILINGKHTSWCPSCLDANSTLVPCLDDVAVLVRFDGKVYCYCKLNAKTWQYLSTKCLYSSVVAARLLHGDILGDIKDAVRETQDDDDGDDDEDDDVDEADDKEQKVQGAEDDVENKKIVGVCNDDGKKKKKKEAKPSLDEYWVMAADRMDEKARAQRHEKRVRDEMKKNARGLQAATSVAASEFTPT